MSDSDWEFLGLAALEDTLPPGYFDELLERIDRRELAVDVLDMVAFALVEATTHFTEMLMSLGLILDRGDLANE